mgnify:CR=1 FL=1
MSTILGVRRRAFLATVTTAAATAGAGCSAGGTGESGDGGSDSDESGDLAAGRGEAPAAFLARTAVTDADLPATVLPAVTESERPPTARFVDRAIDGATTVEGTERPVAVDDPYVYGDGVYELAVEVVDRTSATTYRVRVDVVQGTVVDAETVSFAALPGADRSVFAENRFDDGGTPGVVTYFVYTDAEREGSALVPDPEYSYVVWENGTRAFWAVEGARDTPLETYRYTAERTAATAEYGRRMRERFAFELSELPDPQREVVEAAVDDEYVRGPDETPSAPFAALTDRFRGRRRVRALHETDESDARPNDAATPGGEYLVRYDGEGYWTSLSVRDSALGTDSSR